MEQHDFTSHSAIRLLARLSVSLLCVALLVLMVSPAGAAGSAHEGETDPGFGNGGGVTAPVGLGDDYLTAVALQPDGKIVGVGSTGTTSRFGVVVRFNSDGSLDPTFGGDGTVTTPLRTTADTVAVQSDGKIVVAGSYNDGGLLLDVVVLRYNSNGSLDPTFGDHGEVAARIGAMNQHANAVGVQPDGKIVIGGTAFDQHESDFMVVRLTPNGAFDQTFANGGYRQTPIGASGAAASALLLQPDGNIVLIGSEYNGTNVDFALVRYNANGSLDPTFGTGGEVTTQISSEDDYAFAASIAPDGKIVAAGYAGSGSHADFAVVRYNTDGTLDATFGGDGKVTSPVGPLVDVATGVAVQPNGKIVAGGYVQGGAVYDFAVARYNGDGSLDASFNRVGMAATPVGINSSGHGLVIQPNGGIVVAGHAVGPANYDFTLARYIGDATAPFGAHVMPTPRFSTAPTQTVEWNASDDNTGVKSYDVLSRTTSYHSSTYGTTHTFKAATPHSFGTFTGSPGSTTCFQVRGRDWAGNVGTFSSERCEAFPVAARTLTRRGTWTALAGAYYRGAALRSTTSGATLQLPVGYRHLAVVATTCAGCGTIKVYLGNTLLKTISLSAGSTHHKVLLDVDASTAIRTGTLIIKQVANGRNVTIEGVAVSLA